MSAGPEAITRCLIAIRDGEASVGDLIPLVYRQLRTMARSQLRKEPAGQTLQPTALVHEAFLRLARQSQPDWQSRAHFFSAAAEAMRRILIEQARRKARPRHGGALRRAALSIDSASPQAPAEELLAVDEALGRLEHIDQDMARVVKLRYFVGLSLKETASSLAVSERSVSRQWTAAKAWLYRELSSGSTMPSVP